MAGLEDEKKCPRCAELVKSEATICRFCGFDFPRNLPAMSQQGANSRSKKGGCIALPVVIGLTIIAALGGGFSGSGDEKRDEGAVAMDADASQEAEAANAKFDTKKADERAKGFHCLSAWDGSNRSLIGAVEDGLRDPNSFEHDNTWISPAGRDGHHRIKMVFRARNGFGGMNVAEAIGYVDHDTCTAVLEKVTSLN